MTLKKLAIYTLLFWILGFMTFVCVSMYFSTNPKCTGELLVVLTGDSERISKGASIFKKGDFNKLLISGVGRGVKQSEIDLQNYGDKVILGRIASNTYENAVETDVVIKMHHYNSICLLTSDYHIIRSRILFSFILDDNVRITLNPITNLKKPIMERAMLFFKEYNKVLVVLTTISIDCFIQFFSVCVHRIYNYIFL